MPVRAVGADAGGVALRGRGCVAARHPIRDRRQRRRRLATVLYLFLATVLFGYYLPTRLAVAFLAVGVLVPATPMLYDPDALEATFVAKYFLTAPIYVAVGLTVVWRSASWWPGATRRATSRCMTR